MSTLLESKKLFDPFNEKFHADPYPFYKQLREAAPIHKSYLGIWILTKYQDVKNILRDQRFRADNVPERIYQKGKIYNNDSIKQLSDMSSKWIFFLDPPKHTKFRKLLSKSFSINAIENMRYKITNTVNHLIHAVKPNGRMDILNDFALHIPIITICDLIGLPISDYKKLNRWANHLSYILDPLLPIEMYERMADAAIQFRHYLKKIIQLRKITPGSDLMSLLLAKNSDNETISNEELIAICIVIFITGEETVVNLITNGMLSLLNNKDQLELLKSHPDLIDNAVEELIRFDNPLQYTARIANEEITLHEHTIMPGEKVLVSLGSANRDPEIFNNPDSLNILRGNIKHLGFGGGIHNCLGLTLARMQAKIAINNLIQQCNTLSLTSTALTWSPYIALRRLKALPVTFKA